MEDKKTKPYSFKVKIQKGGNNSLKIPLYKDEGWDLRRDLGKEGILIVDRDSPPPAIEEKFREEIEKKCNSYLSSCYGIYANVFCKLVGNKHYRELITVDNVMRFMEIKRDIIQIKEKRGLELQKEQDNIKRKFRDIVVEHAERDPRKLRPDEHRLIIDSKLYDGNLHEVYYDDALEDSKYVILHKGTAEEYKKLRIRKNQLDDAEIQLDDYVVGKVKEKHPTAHPVVIDAALKDELSEELLEKHSDTILRKLAEPDFFTVKSKKK